MLVITEMNRNYRSITEIFFLLGVCLLGGLEVACLGWKSITEIIRCRSSFATARKRKQAFFLLALNRKSLASLEILDFCMGRLSVSLKERKSLNLFLLRSKYRFLYGLLVWGGLVWRWLLQK